MNDPANFMHLCKFFYKFRALLRSAFAVAIITIPAHLLKVKIIIYVYSDIYKCIHFLLLSQYQIAGHAKLHHLADICVGLESFTGSERTTNPLFKVRNWI